MRRLRKSLSGQVFTAPRLPKPKPLTKYQLRRLISNYPELQKWYEENKGKEGVPFYE